MKDYIFEDYEIQHKFLKNLLQKWENIIKSNKNTELEVVIKERVEEIKKQINNIEMKEPNKFI